MLGGSWCRYQFYMGGERRHDLHAAKLKMENAQFELNEAREKIDLQIRQNRYRYSEALKKS